MRELRVAALAAGFFAVSLCAQVLLSACGDAPLGSTTGKHVVLHTSAKPDATSFTNAIGWKVTLTTAAVSVGALYYFDGASIFSASAEPSLFALRSAFAHPGHYKEGSAMGQALQGGVVDLLAPPTTLPDGDGVTGAVRSARYMFGAAPGSGALGMHVIVLEGTAEKGAETRIFRVDLDTADVADVDNVPQVEGCAFAPEPTDVSGDGTVTVLIKPALWLDQTDFTELPVSTDGKPVAVDHSTVAFRSVARGTKAGDAYVFSFGK